MIQLALITALSIDGVIVIGAVLLFVAVQTGTVEASLSLKVNPLRKRKPEAVIEAGASGEAGT